MAQLIPYLAALVESFRDSFHPQVFQLFQVLIAGWIVCLGSHTLSGRVARPESSTGVSAGLLGTRPCWACHPTGLETRGAEFEDERPDRPDDPLGRIGHSIFGKSECGQSRSRVEARPRGRGSAALEHAAAPNTKVAPKDASRVADSAGSE